MEMFRVFDEMFPDGYDEIRVDIVPDVKCDIVCDIRKLDFDDNSVDGIYTSHVLEHFDCRETQPLLTEWCRVLKPGGVMYHIVPRIDSPKLIEALQQGDPHKVLYDSPAGPVSALHILYGQWYPGEYEVHKWGYTEKTLRELVEPYLVDSVTSQGDFELFIYGFARREKGKKLVNL